MQSRSFSLLSLLGAAILAGSATLVSCGGGDGTNTGGSIALSVSPTSGTVQQGGSVQVTGTITRSGGFTGNVTFAVTGSIPTGLSGAVSSTTTSGDVTTATITLSTTTATPTGTYPITVTGTGSGVTNATATFTLTVTAAPAGSYTLTLNPTSLAINQGSNGTVTVNINRTNFTGGVTLAAENLPGGVTASFNPASPVTANSTTLTLAATSTAVTGTTNITIRGTTPGQSPENTVSALADQTVTLSLTVNVTTAGSYTLSATPTSLSFAVGAGGTSTININRTGGFAGSVTLAATGQPTNMTATVSPSPTTANSATLTITSTSAVVAGNYTITITGTATGVANQTTTVGITVTAAASFTLSASPATLSFAQGGNGTSTITVNPTGGFSGSVALAVTGQVANLTATVSPTSTTSTSTLTVTTTAGVAAAVVPLTITGTSGSITQVITVTVTITAAGSFTLSASPATLSFAQGGNGNSTITINRTGGFAGNVALTVTGQSANMTATLNPTSTTANTSTLTVTTTSGVAVGAVTLTITGTSGSITQTTTVVVTITSTGGGGNVTLNWSACPVTAKAIWVAGLNGTTWTAVTGVNDQYSFTVNASKGGYAYVTQNGTTNSLAVFLGTQAEVVGTVNFCTGTSPTGKTVGATVSGFAGGTFPSVFATLGGIFGNANSFAPTITWNNVPDGSIDLIAWMSDAVAGPAATDRGLAMRGINPANNSNLGTINMAGGSSFVAASATATTTGLISGESVTASMSYLTGAACRSAILYSIITGSASMPMFGFPSAQQVAGDFHSISIITTSGTPPNQSFRTHNEVFAAMGNRTFALAPNFTGTVTSLGGTNKRLQVTGTIPAQYNSGASLTYSSTNPNRGVTISATPGWIGGANLTLGLDEFNSLTGWLSSYAPLAAATVNYTAVVSGFSGFTTNFCAEGATNRVAAFSGTM